MASIKEAKANAVADQAKWAFENHHTHFTPIFNMPMFHVGFSGAVFDWGMMINAIEREGWHLDLVLHYRRWSGHGLRDGDRALRDCRMLDGRVIHH